MKFKTSIQKTNEGEPLAAQAFVVPAMAACALTGDGRQKDLHVLYCNFHYLTMEMKIIFISMFIHENLKIMIRKYKEDTPIGTITKSETF